MNAILSIDDLDCTYERWGVLTRALSGVSLSVLRGEWVMLAGGNGAGKSTLLRILARRLRDFMGRVTLAGQDIRSISGGQHAQIVHYVDQDPRLGTAPMLTVYENLAIADRINDRRPTASKRYNRLLEEFGLTVSLQQPAVTLSGGERQLLALAITKLRACPVVLLDEPLAAIDSRRVPQCIECLRHISSAGVTLLQVSHDLDLAATVGSRTIVLDRGHLVFDQQAPQRARDRVVHYVNGDTPRTVLPRGGEDTHG
jgi:putative ABC transport system ATP-binding protein